MAIRPLHVLNKVIISYELQYFYILRVQFVTDFYNSCHSYGKITNNTVYF